MMWSPLKKKIQRTLAFFKRENKTNWYLSLYMIVNTFFLIKVAYCKKKNLYIYQNALSYIKNLLASVHRNSEKYMGITQKPTFLKNKKKYFCMYPKKHIFVK